jgi:hypothetical protein
MNSKWCWVASETRFYTFTPHSVLKEPGIAITNDSSSVSLLTSYEIALSSHAWRPEDSFIASCSCTSSKSELIDFGAPPEPAYLDTCLRILSIAYQIAIEDE